MCTRVCVCVCVCVCLSAAAESYILGRDTRDPDVPPLLKRAMDSSSAEAATALGICGTLYNYSAYCCVLWIGCGVLRCYLG